MNTPPYTWLHIGILTVATIMAYSKVFSAGFLSWDDGEYVLHNSNIKGLNVHNIKAWFTNFYVGNYHPLTMLSYAIDYALDGLRPFIYHITNLLLHLCNSYLVYVFIKKLQPNISVAFFVALIFSLHPMQTESVSWVAERKTLLSGLFFLVAITQYAAYAQKPNLNKMLWVLVASAAAMLSKGTAVALPLTLFAIDVWLRRPLDNLKIWVEKIPLLCMSLIVGIVAVHAQESGKFVDTHRVYSVGENIFYAGYAYVQYIVRFLAPVKLSAMYPYPWKIGLAQYLFTAFAIGTAIIAYIAYRKKWNILCGGVLFYTANIIFLLQLIPFGEALTADRYMYIASLGLIFPVVLYVFEWSGERKNVAIATSGILAGALLSSTYMRNTAWQSDTNFFSAMLETHPNSSVAEYSVGAMHLKNGDYNNAELHLNRAVQLDPRNFKAWHNKGTLHLRQHKTTDALTALGHSIAINGYNKAYFTRALLHHATGRPDLAISDLEHVLAIQPKNARAWHLKGECLAQLGIFSAAIENYNKAIEYDATEPIFYIRRGMTFSKTRQYSMALSDLNTAIALNPANGEAFYFRAVIKHQAGQSPCTDLQDAIRRGYNRAGEMLQKICTGK